MYFIFCLIILCIGAYKNDMGLLLISVLFAFANGLELIANAIKHDKRNKTININNQE